MGLVRWLAGLFGAGGPGNDVQTPPAGTAPPPAKRRKKRRRTAPLSNSQTRWYLADLEGAIRLADLGDLQRAGMLYRALQRDGVVKGLLQTRTGGLVRMKRKFTGDPEVSAALEGTGRARSLFDELFPPAELALLAADGIVLGVGVAEMVDVFVTTLVDGVPVELATHKEMRRLDPQYLRYRWDEDRWYYNALDGQLLITPGDGRWILHCPGGKGEPWAHGQWSCLGRAYITKEHALLHRENYSAKLANPARVAVAPLGATDPQRLSWFQRVMAWGVNTVFAVSPGYDVKLLESNGRGFEVFEKTIETSDREYMIALVGNTVMIDGGTGFSNAGIHEQVTASLIEETGDSLAHTLNEQAIPPWANACYGAGRRSYVAYDTTAPKNLTAETQTLVGVGGAIEALDRAMRPHGLELDAAQVLTRFNVPVSGDITGDGLPDATTGVVTTDPSEAPLEEDAVSALAAKMTQYGVERCEHGRANRCWLCGIERVRDFEQGPNGPQWRIAWRPIGQAATAPASAPQQQAA